MNKYLAYTKIGISKATAFRGPILIWIMGNIFSVSVIAAIWLSAKGGDTFGGYTKNQMIEYYVFGLLLQWVINWLPFYSVTKEIKNGDLAVNVILKPVSLFLSKFFDDVGYHIVSIGVGVAGSFFLAIFFVNTLEINYSFNTLMLIVPAICLATIIVFTSSLVLGLLAFWFTEVDFFDTVFWTGRLFLGGQAIPVSFFPDSIRSLINFLPFRYTFSFPMEILFSQLSTSQIVSGFLIQIFWVMALLLIYKVLWAKGRIAYTSFGH